MYVVNINKDSEEIIAQLPGLDLNLARKVVEARDKGIIFTSIDQLAIFLQLKPHIIHKLEGLVSFEYENNLSSSSSNNVKRRTHKARVLDFNGNLDNSNSNIKVPNQGKTQSNIHSDNVESNHEPNINSDIEVSSQEITNPNVNFDVNELNSNPDMMGNDINSNINKSNENHEISVSNSNSNIELNSNQEIKQSTVNSRPNDSSEIRRSKVKIEFKICPKCNYQNEIDGKFCVSCGNKLPDNQLNNNSKLNICPNCKKENDFDSNFCVFCGTKLSENNLNNNIKSDSSISKGNTNHKSRRLDF